MWEEGKTFKKKLTRRVWIGSGIWFYLKAGPAHPNLSPSLWSVLPGWWAKPWLAGRGRVAVWSGKEQSRGPEGPSLSLQLTHSTSHARHFTTQSIRKMRRRPKSGFHREIQMPFTRINTAAVLSLWSLFLCCCVSVCVFSLIISLCSLSSYFLCRLSLGLDFGLNLCHCLQL